MSHSAEVLEDRTMLTVFTVTCAGSDGTGSLRNQIDAANLNVGTNTIEFDLSGGPTYTISLTSALPIITDPVIIDGQSQSG